MFYDYDMIVYLYFLYFYCFVVGFWMGEFLKIGKYKYVDLYDYYICGWD